MKTTQHTPSSYVYPGTFKAEDTVVKLSPVEILSMVCAVTGFNREQLEHKKKSAKLVEARTLYFALCYKFSQSTQTECALLVKRDRTTLIHHSQKMQDVLRYEADSDIAKKYRLLLDKIYKKLQ